MSEFLTIVQEWGPYLGLPIVVAFITQGLKINVSFFKSVFGQRLLHFVPLVLGVLGGLLLPEETWQSKLLVGGGLGSVSIALYKIVTVSLDNKAKLEERILRKSIPLDE